MQQTESSTRLVVVDVSAIWWTAWHSSGEEELSAARHRTLSMVERYTAGYDHVALALDSPASWRRDEVSSYKAQRPKKSTQSLDEMRRTLDELRQLHRCFEADGYEGDDVIAALCAWASTHEPPIDTTIVGVDKDLLVCLGPRVEIHKFSDDSWVAAVDLESKMGIEPHQVPGWLALMGDKSDNIAGVAGVGPKGAAKLLRAHSSVSGVIAAVNSTPMAFPPKKLENLRNAITGSPSVLDTALRLVRLRADCLTPEQCATALESYDPPRRPQQEIATMPPEPDEEAIMEIHVEPGWECVSAPKGAKVIPAPTSDDECTVERRQNPSTGATTKANASPSGSRDRAVDGGPTPPKNGNDGAESPNPRGGTGSSGASFTAAAPSARALALTGDFSLRLEPRDMRQAVWIASKVNSSRLCARKFKNADEVLMVIMAGAERGLGVWSAIKATHVIEGTISWHAHYIIGEAKKHPDCEYFYLRKGSDEKSATYVTKRRGSPKEEEITATIEDAERAGLLDRRGSNWVRIPKDMLRKQAGVALARAVYPESTMGLYSPEELSGGRVVDAEYEVTK